nr:tigger transposable element-derived protein 2-like [Nomia melanderi]
MSAGRSNKKTCLSVRQQLELVKVLEKGVPIREVAAKYNLHVSTVWRIKRRAVEIHRLAEQEGFEEKKKIRSAKHEVLEARVYAWFLEQKTDVITNKVLREKAIEINKEIGGPSDFRGSEGWLWRFKQRYRISYLTNQSENDAPEKPAVKIFLRDLKRIIRDRGIDPEHLYNMQETGLTWKLLPTRLLVHAAERTVDERTITKEKVTIGFCANATGTHKLPILFVNKDDSPRALKHCRDHLPVVYKSREKARLDEKVFADWYENDFKISVSKHQSETGKYGPVLLVVDDSKARYLPAETARDDRFAIVYLPLDTTSIRQPMNEGILKNVKNSFRCKMLRRMFSFNGVEQFYDNYDLKDCMDILHDAWTTVTSASIRNSWSEILQRVPDINSRFWCSRSEKMNYCITRESIETITGGNITVDEVGNWMSTCAEIEDNMEQGTDMDGTISQLPSDNESCLGEREMERTFKQIILWFKKEPEFLQMQVQCLKSYYDKIK